MTALLHIVLALFFWGIITLVFVFATAGGWRPPAVVKMVTILSTGILANWITGKIMKPVWKKKKENKK